jgi:hypothetical protein
MEKGECRGTAVANTAFETHCYSFTMPDGEKSAEFEDHIAKVESVAAPVIDKVIAGATLTAAEQAELSAFMALTYVRTDVFRLQFATMSMWMLQVQNYHTAKSDTAFARAVEDYEKYKGKKMTEEEKGHLREGMLRPEDFKVTVDKGWTLQALTFAEHLLPIFNAMHWTTLVSDPEHHFITSDNPLVHGVPDHKRSNIYGVGFMSKDIEITLPISTNVALLGVWRDDFVKRARASPAVVKVMNRHRAIYANRFLFGSVRDAGILALAAKYKDTKPSMKMSGAGPEQLSPVSLRRVR